MASRNIWNDHAWRIRNYIVSSLSSAPDSESALKWTEENLSEIAQQVKTYYGDDAAVKFLSLLQKIVDGIFYKIQQSKAGESISSITDDDQESLSELATFLDSANQVYWKKEAVLPILQKVFALWVNQILARIASEWNLDLQYTDEIHSELLKLADIFSSGIIAQFPNSFSMGGQNVL